MEINVDDKQDKKLLITPTWRCIKINYMKQKNGKLIRNKIGLTRMVKKSILFVIASLTLIVKAISWCFNNL